MQNTFKGSCHCGKINLEFSTHLKKSEIIPRSDAASCKFCATQDGTWISDPRGSLKITARKADFTTYKFATETVEFYFCRHCHTLCTAHFEKHYAVARLGLFPQLLSQREQTIQTDFSQESVKEGKRRRRKNWTPVVWDWQDSSGKQEEITAFQDWIEVKQKIHLKENPDIFVNKGEIRWIYMGKNVGSESTGKGRDFFRPALVIADFYRGCFVIPLTTTQREGSYFFSFNDSTGRRQCAILSQMKYVDYNRVAAQISFIKKEDYTLLEQKLLDLIRS